MEADHWWSAGREFVLKSFMTSLSRLSLQVLQTLHSFLLFSLFNESSSTAQAIRRLMGRWFKDEFYGLYRDVIQSVRGHNSSINFQILGKTENSVVCFSEKGKIKGKAIPVTGSGGPWDCETSRLPHFPHNRLTDAGEIISLMLRPPSASQEDS
jgi:hypothetical protein